MLQRSLILALVFLCSACASTPTSKSGVAFVHAAVIPMDQERILRDHTVVVADGKIVEVGPSAAVKVPAGAERIDATGKYLMPALCDMHVHLLSDAWNIMLPPEAQLTGKDVPYEDFLFPYVAMGVTTVQVLSATPEDIAQRMRISGGDLVGPRLILARMIDGPRKAWPPPLSTWVATPEEAREAARNARAAGYDKIKVYSFLSKESYDAIVETARELGMDVIGHIPMSVSLDHVLEGNQKLIAHTEEVLKHIGNDFSAERIDAVAAKIAGRQVWMTPTLVTTHSILELFADEEKLLGRPEATYFRHPMELGVWNFMVKNLYRPIPPAARQHIHDGYEKFQRPLTRVLHDKGGKLMTGTDSLLPGLVPGFALHRELQELIDVGLTPYEALRTSTTMPFEYLGENDRSGVVRVGMHTDLLLLNENPLEDVSAASKIAGVLMRGRWTGAEEIRKRMQEIAESPGASGAQ